jgi:ribonuclease BN (tRNA processing enzyme)
MQKSSLTCFGVGDGFPCADRNHASFLYRLGKTTILVDCGEPLDGTFQASGLSYNLIDGIFISHLHADHVGGLFMFLQGCWLEGRRKALPVYVPANTSKPLRGMLRAALLFDELFKFSLQLKPLRAGKPIAISDVRVTPFATTHLARVRAALGRKYRSTFACHCFLLESGPLRIGHSADLGKPEDLDPLLKKPLDLLVCEMAHFKPEAIFSYLQGRPIKRIAFVHLARPYWADLPGIRRLAARMLPDIPHTFPKDGAVIPL